MVLAILQARMSSSRLPGKVLKLVLGKPILSYQIERIKKSKLIDKIVLATSINKDDDPLEDLAKRLNIECFRGDLNNVLKRFYDCATLYKADTVVRLTGDCPVADPKVIDDVIELHIDSDGDFTSNTIVRTFPDGLDVEVMSYETLKIVFENASTEDELEHVTEYIYTNKNRFIVNNFSNEIDYSYMRWTLDTIDDFYFFKQIYETNKQYFSWKELLAHTTDGKKYLIDSNQTIRYAMKKLEETADEDREALYIIKGNEILGTLSTSDIRRALIYESITNNDQVTSVMNRSFVYLTENKSYTKDELKKLLRFKQLPLLDSSKDLIKFVDIKELMSHKNRVVLMAGGLGTRLGNITSDTPKPMLKIGGRPILETIIEQFSKYGFRELFISVNYLSDLVVEYFGNGEKFDVSIRYLNEIKRLGTAGCLGLIEEDLEEPFFIMNGDILTDIDFEDMLNYHIEQDNEVTIAAIKNSYNIPYGVIELKNNRVSEILEKPSYSYMVSGGIYILNPDLKGEIPKNEYFDITTLFERLLGEDRKIGVYEIDGYWLDIGRPDDYYKAHREYIEVFKKDGNDN
ncbi:MAG: sugar phosphate nucleotidyltransferase [Sulfuricurvum sp.]